MRPWIDTACLLNRLDHHHHHWSTKVQKLPPPVGRLARTLSPAVAMSGERGTGAARRRREGRMRSWWHHEQPCITAHSVVPMQGLRRTPPHVDRGQPRRWRLTSSTTPHRDRSSLHWGSGWHLCLRSPSRRRPSLVVAPVAAHDGLDQATVQFLLQQSLLARAEEEEAREQAELDQLEDEARMEGRLLEDTAEVVRVTRRSWASLSGWRGPQLSVLWPRKR